MTNILSGLKDLFEKNVIIRGLIAIMLLGTLCYMYINSIEVPKDLIVLTSTALGFYFGGVKQINPS